MEVEQLIFANMMFLVLLLIVLAAMLFAKSQRRPPKRRFLEKNDYRRIKEEISEPAYL